MRSIVDYVMIFKGRGLKMGVFVGGGGGGGGLTWTLILRIFGMVSITFFFAPPLGSYSRFFHWVVGVAYRGLLLFWVGLVGVAYRGLLLFRVGLVARSGFSLVLL